MRLIDADELKIILTKHLHWLRRDCGGWEDMKANLGYADLGCADLRGANLGDADLRGANLRGANLGCANLGHADLGDADLRGANLGYADLGYADLGYADLGYADLRYADLRGANLRDADLRGANLRDATGLFVPLICPSEGEFIGWKKCKNDVIVKLLIPDKALRLSATSRKCRASEAKVLAIYDKSGDEIQEATSKYDKNFFYKVGETVRPSKPFDTDRWKECSSGIHFFITREEAERYKP